MPLKMDLHGISTRYAMHDIPILIDQRDQRCAHAYSNSGSTKNGENVEPLALAIAR